MTDNKQIIHSVKKSIHSGVNRLDSMVNKKEKPWYKKSATVVAAMALFFSLGTTFVTYVKTMQQDVISSRIELRDLVKAITNIPQEHAEVLLKFKKEPLTVSELAYHLSSKNLTLSNQAEAVIERIEDSFFGKGTVLDIEYLTVGTALLSSFQVKKSKFFFEEACKRARDATTEAGALRSLANVFAVSGDVEMMRKYFRKAMNIYKKKNYANDPDINKNTTNAITGLEWAFIEFQLGEYKNASIHLNNSLPLLKLIPDSPFKNQLISQVNLIRNNINKMCKN